ncbi:U3 small nucleolar RNA-associated protein [Pholiota molesta]|nr:U3 small nucleolar RNA-associated protein [Pholiota molesta]
MAVPQPVRPKLKTAFKKARTVAPLYTSGAVAVTSDGTRLVTCVAEDILLTNIENGQEICRFVGDTQAINSLCITPSSSHLLVFTASLSLRVYELPDSKEPLKKRVPPIRVVGRAHEAPVHVCIADPTSTYLASGSADGVVKVWHILRGYTTHVFKGHGGVVSALAFHYPFDASVVVSADGRWLVSGGRDSVVLIWDLQSKTSTAGSAKVKKGAKKTTALTPTLVKTVPALERVEAVGILRSDDDMLKFYTGGEKEFYVPSTSTAISVHADQNIIFHSLRDGTLSRQFVGYNDEIVDASFLSYPTSTTDDTLQRDSHIALATNSSLIRVYSTKNLDARLLDGHSEIVLALDHSADGSLLASGSKDKTARIWAPISAETDETGSAWGYGCVGICEGHAESVGAVALARGATKAVNSCSRAVKIAPSKCGTCRSSRALYNWQRRRGTLQEFDDHKAHEKDINSLDVAPNDRFLVSGSQDRTAKVFEIVYIVGAGGAVRGELKLIGTCKGHKRGCGRGDKTVKLWSLDDYSCLRTFEGHTNSVLRVDFLNAGLQLISTGSDGLAKLWNVREEECVATLDNHEDKVPADSVVTFWEDCTEEDEVVKETKRTEMALKDQDFMNYVELRDYKRAIQLALAMAQPGRLCLFSKRFLRNPSVDEVIRTLSGPELAKLLRFVRDWNTNAKTSAVAQRILFAITKLRTADDIIQAFGEENTEKLANCPQELVDALIPYSERHLSRMDRLVQESYVVDYILGEMDDGMFGNDFMGDDDDAVMDVDH